MTRPLAGCQGIPRKQDYGGTVDYNSHRSGGIAALTAETLRLKSEIQFLFDGEDRILEIHVCPAGVLDFLFSAASAEDEIEEQAFFSHGRRQKSSPVHPAGSICLELFGNTAWYMAKNFNFGAF